MVRARADTVPGARAEGVGWPAACFVVLALAAVAPAACRKSAPQAPPAAAPSRPILGEVVVRSDGAGDPALAVDGAALSAGARARALSSGLFDTTAADAGAARSVARVRIDLHVETVEVKDRGAARAAAQAHLECRPEGAPGALAGDGEAALEKIYALGVKPAPDRRALLGAVAARAVDEAIDDLVARLRLRDATPSAVHAAIIAADAGERREEAIRVAGARGLRGEIPTLLGLLQDDNEIVRDAALGALVALHAQEAVPVLAKSRSLRDRREMRKILDAIATLGGREAAEYLSFVAEGHDDEEIRAMAADAKARLERRAAPAPRR